MHEISVTKEFQDSFPPIKNDFSVLKLSEQNIIVRGSLNPSIIQPGWLQKNKFIPEGEQIAVKFQIGQSAPAEYDWQGHYRWTVDHAVLKVNVPVDQKPASLVDFISVVFGKLEHTPVSAIGQNFVFDGKPDEIDLNFFNQKDWRVNQKTKLGNVSNLKHEVTFVVDDVSKINVYLINSSGKTQIHINFHYDVASAHDVVRYAKKIEDNFKSANEIIREIANQ